MAGKSFLATLILLLALQSSAWAQTTQDVLTSQPVWSQLNAQERTALAPLSREWNSMPDSRKKRWLGIAHRYASLSAIEQARLQDRMRDWIALTPAQRELARSEYKKLRSAPQEQKEELGRKWQEYEALSNEEKQRLQAVPVARIATPAGASQSATPYSSTIPKLLIQAPPSAKGRPLAVVSQPANNPAR